MKQEQLGVAALCFGTEVAIIWLGRVLFGSEWCKHQFGYTPRCRDLTWNLDWVSLLLVTVPVLAVAWIAGQSPAAPADGNSEGGKIALPFVFATTLYPITVFGNLFLYAIWGVSFVLVYGKNFIEGAHFLFVPHPTQSIIARPLQTGDRIDHRALGVTLRQQVEDSGAKPQFHYENQAKRARKLKEKLDAETAMAEAKTRRELAHAALLDAEREIEKAKRRAKG